MYVYVVRYILTIYLPTYVLYDTTILFCTIDIARVNNGIWCVFQGQKPITNRLNFPKLVLHKIGYGVATGSCDGVSRASGALCNRKGIESNAVFRRRLCRWYTKKLRYSNEPCVSIPIGNLLPPATWRISRRGSVSGDSGGGLIGPVVLRFTNKLHENLCT